MSGDDYDGLDTDALLAAWDEADRRAKDLLSDLCRDVLDEPAPHEALVAAAALRSGLASEDPAYDYLREAGAWSGSTTSLPDLSLWVAALTTTLDPADDPFAGDEDSDEPSDEAEGLSAVMALEHADLVGLAVAASRGVGRRLDAAAVDAVVLSIDELEPDGPLDPDDLDVLDRALSFLQPLWQILGVLDDDARLTPLGRWGLPQAILVSWSHL